MKSMPIRYAILALAIAGLALSQDIKKLSHAEAVANVQSRVDPSYPPAARQLKVQGNVEVQVVINENGKVEKAEPLTGNPILTRAAVDAVKMWKFKPFIDGGKQTSVQATISFSFKL
jgi:protein TonB